MRQVSTGRLCERCVSTCPPEIDIRAERSRAAPLSSRSPPADFLCRVLTALHDDCISLEFGIRESHRQARACCSDSMRFCCHWAARLVICRLLSPSFLQSRGLAVPPVHRLTVRLQDSVRVKDAMRDDCVTTLVDAISQIIVVYEVRSRPDRPQSATDLLPLRSALSSHLGYPQAELPELAAGALSAFRPYIEWIDVALVAGERFSPVLLRSLWSSSCALPLHSAHLCSARASLRLAKSSKMIHSSSESRIFHLLTLTSLFLVNGHCGCAVSVRTGAAGCVRELVAKRMPALAKLSLIQRLQLVEVWTPSALFI